MKKVLILLLIVPFVPRVRKTLLKINPKIIKNTLFLLLLLSCLSVSAQQNSDKLPPMVYRTTPTRVNDLVHTKLAVSFDYKKRYLYGKEWVTLKPHFYPTDTLRLNAKGMDIHNVSLVKEGKLLPLKFAYDSVTIAIRLDKVYHSDEHYTIYIDYTSKPDGVKLTGFDAAIGAKGLFFINPDSTVKGKPVQIWTQGETEGSSIWFPTIDNPAQKTTNEISMTVPAKYVTLSNGYLASQKNNGNGTRTDTWKMDLPHSPYLFMMAVGDFKIYKDKWRGKEVSYYLEPAYAPYAKGFFGKTPNMMEFFSKTLGVDFPWNKYAQIVVRDYMLGAMENTTATLHADYANKTDREMIDDTYDSGESYVAHELFHQWFGDYVTTENWSYITVNESFADFSEILWAEHEYGPDEADAHNHAAMRDYFADSSGRKLPMVNFYYANPFDAFQIAYTKGGRILNMLRNYLGSDAFLKGLNIYLTTNAFKTGEPQQLRLAFQQASGLDLNWFFNQWFYGIGHPELNINYKWDEATKTETVYLQQTQPGQTFKLPMAVDIYAAGKKERFKICMNRKADTLVFHAITKPDLVNVDGDKILLAEKQDHKTLKEYVFQYHNAPLYLDRYEAIAAAADSQSNAAAQNLLISALKDKYYILRLKAMYALDMNNAAIAGAAISLLTTIAQNDSSTLVRARAIITLAKIKTPGNEALFRKSLTSRSYAIQAAALMGIDSLHPKDALTIAKGFEHDNKGPLTAAIVHIYATSGKSDKWPFVYAIFADGNTDKKYNILADFAVFIGTVNDPEYAQQGMIQLRDLAIKYKNPLFGNVAIMVKKQLADIKIQRAKLNDTASGQFADAAIKQIDAAN